MKMKKVMWIAVFCMLAASVPAQMIGLDFRTAHISGWHAVESVDVNGGSLIDLTDVNGSNTTIDVYFDNGTDGNSLTVATAYTASTIPPELTGLDGYLYDPNTLTVTFSNLTPGASCHIYVLGSATASAGPPKSTLISITGGTSINFTQTTATALDLMINDQLGSSAQPMSNYKKTVPADSNGMVVITCTAGENNWRIAGIALKQEEDMTPKVEITSSFLPGNSLYPGSTSDVFLVAKNTGFSPVSNVTLTVSAPGAGNFQLTGAVNSEYGVLDPGEAFTNTTPFRITAATNAALGGPFNFSVQVTGAAGTDILPPTGAYSTSSVFAVSTRQGFSVAPVSIGLVSDVNETVTNMEIIVTNSADIPLQCSFTASDAWLTVPASLSVLPRSAAAITVTAGPIGVQTQLAGMVTATYSQPATNLLNSLTVMFDVGARVSFVSNQVTVVSGGTLPVIPPGYDAEAGMILNIEVYNVNDGAVSISNVINSLDADPAYFKVTALTPVNYPSLAVGQSTSTVYQVEITADVPHGENTFYVTNRAVNP